MRRTTMPQLLLLCFAALLLVAVLISERANRTVLSTAVLFLLGGFVLGKGMLGVIDIRTGDPLVAGLAELALFSVLFTDGMRVGVADLRSAWRLPGRALLLGLPLTLVITAAAAHYVAGLPWLHSFLMGAILAPTDPVFAAAIVGREAQQEELGHRRPSHGAGWSVLLEDVLGQADLVTLGADDPPSHRSMISGSRSGARGRPASAACRLPVVWNAAVRGVDDREPVAMSPGVKPDESPARRTLQLRSVCGCCSILARGMGPGTWVHSRSSP